jgi:hypothetical protein
LYTLSITANYAQTPIRITHEPLSLIVRYSWHGFVLCICLVIILYMLLNPSKTQFINKKFLYVITDM